MKHVNTRRHAARRSGATALVATLVTAAAAAVVALAGSAAPALGVANSAPSSATTSTSGVQPAAPAGRACTPADIAISVGGTGAYQGHATQELTLTNRAGDACFLAGAPSTTLLFDDGSQQATALGQFVASRVDLAPGGSALVLLGAPGACAGADPSKSRVARRVTLGLPAGSMPVQGVNLDVQCGQSSVVLVVATGP